MNLDDLTKLQWLEPWYPAASAGLEAELEKELAPSHPLFGSRAVAVGRRADCDDALFFLPDNSLPLAVVHLTWSGGGGNREWPRTTFYESLDDWVERRMKPDHWEFECGAE
jgi:hypothetical protein